jgi:hypothetical protein
MNTLEDKIKYLDQLKKRYPILIQLRDKFELKVINVYERKVPIKSK